MMINIISDTNFKAIVDYSLLKSAIALTLDSVNKAKVDLSLKITGDKELHQLNKTYRHIDKPTDVLAFSQDYSDPETGRHYLGDIIISVEQAQLQADENQQSVNEACARLAIHGTLHLLGYDHAEPKDKAIMWDKQESLLTTVMASYLEE